MIPRAALIAALPREAQSMCQNGYIDPADAFISWATGLTPTQAASRARNAARGLGQSWPDRLPASAMLDHAEALEIKHSCGFHGADPLDLLLAQEAAQAACEAEDAARRELAQDWREADTRRLSDMFGLTQRRAQQIKKAALQATEAGQADLFGGDEDE